MIHEDALNIYTDGSSYSGPRTGGIGIRFVTIDNAGDEVVEDLPIPGYKNATNNSMELFACIVAIQKASTHPKISFLNRICIFTDSRYVVDNYKKAIFQWSRQKWLTTSGSPVLNAGLWRQLVREIKKDDWQYFVSKQGGDIFFPAIIFQISDGVKGKKMSLNSCAAGVGVMNIDNGFGAACLAHRINILGPES